MIREQEDESAVVSVREGRTGRGVFAARRIEEGRCAIRDVPLAFADRAELLSVTCHLPSLLCLLTQKVLEKPALRESLLLLHDLSGKVIVPGAVDEAERAGVKRLVQRFGLRADPFRLYLILLRLNLCYCSSSVRIASEQRRLLLGSGYYPRLAYLNHSCEPSCRLEFSADEAREISLVTLRALEPGEELTFAYQEPLLPDSKARRMSLFFTYGFNCGCTRCERELAENKRLFIINEKPSLYSLSSSSSSFRVFCFFVFCGCAGSRASASAPIRRSACSHRAANSLEYSSRKRCRLASASLR
jgi:hypothetical protein